ncbi:AraC family transcriptional regulator [Variovorax robiniae]|uniref:AraC family transcriptional regulator n=1 Tax=Variovorax robiniae TaxID=1836199 RepID=A0ABU8XH69_9BURK
MTEWTFPDHERYTICSAEAAQRNASGSPLIELPAQWAGLPVGAYPILPKLESGAACVSAPMLLMATRGRGRRWYRFEHRTVELATAPGMIELYGRDFQRSGARWDGESGMTVGVFLSPERVHRLAPELHGFDLKTMHEVFDPKLQWLVQELVDEALRGAPGGALYAQGLSSALIGRLGEHYGAPVAAAPPGQLRDNSRRRVLDLIEANLAMDLSVEALARETGLSPHHFAKCFKASMGCTPHRYVRERRLDRSRTLLKDTAMSIAEIALTLGFAGQSHFTQAFRETFGVTPATARKS